MWTTILAAVLLTAPVPQQADTTFAVDPNSRLRMEDIRADVTIHTWNQPRIRVRLDEDELRRLRVDVGSSAVRVGFDRLFGPDGGADLDLTIPATMAISVSGPNGDVRIEGAGGEVNVETVNGEIELSGGRGLVSLHAVQGDITIRDASGRLDLHAVSGDIAARDLTGDLVAESISGDVNLHRIDSGNVQASTVSGDMDYDGTVRDGGRYTLSSHSGDVTFGMPARVDATISVSTFSGDFESDVPVQLTEQRRGRQFSFTLGSGSARVELQSFSGDIRLVHAGAAADH